MALKFWNGTTSSSVETAANYTPSGVPADADELVYGNGSQASTGDLETSEGINLLALRVVSPFSGNLGTDAANPLTFAAMDATNGVLEINCDPGEAQTIFLKVVSVPELIIRNTGSNTNALHFVGTAFTNVTIEGGKRITFGTGCSLAASGEMEIHADDLQPIPVVDFSSGFSMNATSKIVVGRARVRTYAAMAGTLDLGPQGYLEHLATGASPNIGTLISRGKAYLKTTAGGTLTVCRTHGNGLIDSSGSGAGWTLTNGRATGSSKMLFRPGIDTFTNPVKRTGAASVTGGATTTLASSA